jgi:hypothetical protein
MIRLEVFGDAATMTSVAAAGRGRRTTLGG